MNSLLRECFANKLMEAGDTVGATLSRAGFTIKKNKQRDQILSQVVKETDSVKTLVASTIFNN